MQLFLRTGGKSNNWDIEVINNARMEAERETAELSWSPRFFPAKPFAWQDIPRYPNNFRVCLLAQERLRGWWKCFLKANDKEVHEFKSMGISLLTYLEAENRMEGLDTAQLMFRKIFWVLSYISFGYVGFKGGLWLGVKPYLTHRSHRSSHGLSRDALIGVELSSYCFNTTNLAQQCLFRENHKHTSKEVEYSVLCLKAK